MGAVSLQISLMAESQDQHVLTYVLIWLLLESVWNSIVDRDLCIIKSSSKQLSKGGEILLLYDGVCIFRYRLHETQEFSQFSLIHSASYILSSSKFVKSSHWIVITDNIYIVSLSGIPHKFLMNHMWYTMYIVCVTWLLNVKKMGQYQISVSLNMSLLWL